MLIKRSSWLVVLLDLSSVFTLFHTSLEPRRSTPRFRIQLLSAHAPWSPRVIRVASVIPTHLERVSPLLAIVCVRQCGFVL